MSFQTTINRQPAPAVAGDFASANPRASVIAGESALIVGTGGVLVGSFAWADANGVVTNAGAAAPTGFVHREMQAAITTWLAESGMVVPAGSIITLMGEGDFWAKTVGSAAAVGNKVFASNTTGAIKCGAAGATIAGYTETRFTVRSVAADGELFKMTTWG